MIFDCKYRIVLQNAADICYPIQKACNPFNLYYSYDGSCNNLLFTHWGQAGFPFVRLLAANYSDGNYYIQQYQTISYILEKKSSNIINRLI